MAIQSETQGLPKNVSCENFSTSHNFSNLINLNIILCLLETFLDPFVTKDDPGLNLTSCKLVRVSCES